MIAVGAVALDANVLVPIVACDFLLTAFDHGLYEPVVSAAVLDEVERTLLEDFPHIDPAGLRRRVGYLRLALADHAVETTEAEVPEAINPKDRHVVGAALAAEATLLVTEDTALRREIDAARIGVEPVDVDAFAVRLWTASPAGVDETIHRLIAKRRRRPISEAEMAAQLAAHFPSMSAAWLARTKG
ncbi:MAG TPA: PIN domain-containing protein [Acidimicrobiales bacterium]|nr:PIN domain-containing protein [Acidimicrobiales bacterium]